MAEMNVYSYMKRGYDDFCGFGRRKNKANSKPIKANLKIPQMPRLAWLYCGRLTNAWCLI